MVKNTLCQIKKNSSSEKAKAEKILNENLENSLKTLVETPNSIDSDYELIKQIMLEEEEKASQVLNVWKPNINKYPDAVIYVDDLTVFVPEIGDRVVIEFSNDDWRDSVYGSVMMIDEETGNFRVWDERKTYYITSNFNTFRKHGIKIKLAPKRITSLRSQRKTISQLESEDFFQEIKKRTGRGRPKGSKNRPKEIINDEKKKLSEEKIYKQEIKEMRKKIKKMKSMK